ncbi:hypothetical protein CYMTET_29655 [Cymbomonas tetramitiformis]|uniref:Enoyl reductase (ER) domain-containing protein n=1 Tax=Cymbomonas tetramitiformis TaxID=36881 RepID=A0AAE0KUY1_9CHLO|nr:hypothetical protein CYMTET_29655 [Cymbomonas tetramitiformis]
MRAYVALTANAKTQGYLPSFSPPPKLGSLRKKYLGLPQSCEVLLWTLASSINPSDFHPAIPNETLPQVMGSDVCGSVIAVESHCTRLKVGDIVWGDIGANVKVAVAGGGNTSTKELGAFGEFSLALETQLSVAPKNLNVLEIASLPKVALTSYKALTWYADALNATGIWAKRPTVLVLGGSGGTGTTGLQLARAFGASEIITTTSPRNFAYCASNGATKLIDYHSENWWDDAVVPADSVDVVYDTVGQSGTGDRAMEKLKRGGYYVTITGQLASRVKEGTHQAFFINSDTNLDNYKMLEDLVKLVEADRLRMKSLRVFDLSEVPLAFNTSQEGHVTGKLVIAVGKDAVQKPTV